MSEQNVTATATGPDPILQQIQITPKDTMTFKGMFEADISQELTFTNPTDATISFKLKGTSPHTISQRPGFGYIQPKGKAVINVTIKPLNAKMRLPGKQRLTAMLAVAPNDKPANAVDLWKTKEIEKVALRITTKLKFKRKKGKKDKKGGKKGNEKDEGSEKEEESEDSGSDSSASDSDIE